MGKYDDILAGLPTPKAGKYDDLTAGLPSVRENAESIEPGIYGETDPTGQKILENLGAVAGGYGVGQLAAGAGELALKAAGSDLGKALIRSPKNLGQDYAAQDAAVGVKKTTPQVASRATFENPYDNPMRLKPPRSIPVKTAFESNLVGAEPLPSNVPTKVPGDFAAFKNLADSRIDTFGDKLSPQELMNYKVHLETKMADGSIPKYKPREDGGGITTIYHQASDLRSKIANTFKGVMDNQLEGKTLPEGTIPTRTQLDKVNTLSNNISQIPGKVARGAKTTAKYGAIGTGLAAALGAGYKYLND